MLFTINDHGGPATVIALLQSGDKLADLSLAGAENTDWEDIATTVIQGQVSWDWWTVELETKAIRRFAKVTIVPYSRPSLMIIELASQFHVYFTLGSTPF